MTADEHDVRNARDGEQPGKLAGGCVLTVAAAIAGGVVYAVPELGYTIAGALAAAGVRRARTWVAGRREQPAGEQPEEAEEADIVAVLQYLGQGAQHVRLTQLQEAAGLPDTKVARTLLDEAGIPVRPGVRAGGRNGPGVHHDDIPPALPSESSTHSGRCLCRSKPTPTPTTTGEGSAREGFRVEHTGQAGTTVYDLSETHRHHATTKH